MEERDPNGVTVARNLIQLFAGKFRDMQYTVHPAGLPGEAPGKSSNVSWAAKQIQRKYLHDPNWMSVLVTVMDSKPFDEARLVRIIKLTLRQVTPTF